MDNQNQRPPNCGQPVDKGWSWAICIGGFIAYFLTGVSTQALSVLNLELAHHFKVSLTVASLTLMMQVLCLSVSTIFSVGILVPKFGERRVTIVAGVIFGGCSLACSHVPHIAIFIIFCGVQGLSVGAILVPVMGILNYYFDKHRSKAVAICGAGLCISNIISPHLIRMLMDTLGLELTFLLLGVLELGMVVAGILLRPLSYYRNEGNNDGGDVEEILISEQSDRCCCSRIFRKVFHPDLFVQWEFRLFLVTSVLGSTTLYLFEYMPTIAVLKGATKNDGATIYTVCGAVDLVSRMATGLLADRHILKATQIGAISLMCLGIICQFNQLFTDFQTMMGMGVLVGLFVGTRTSLAPVMVKDIVGVDKMSRCYSFAFVLSTFFVAVHVIVLSAIADHMHSFTAVLHYVGIAMILSAAGLLALPSVARCQRRRRALNTTDQ